MEIALSFGVIPFLTGRTLLTVGLLVTYYSLRLALAEGALTPRTVLQGAVGAAMAVMAQALAQWAREAVRELTETVRSLERRLNAMAMSVVAMLFALFILGRFGHQLAASGTGVDTAGIDFTLLVVLAVGAVAFWFATLRGRVADVLEKLPLLDQVGVRRVAFVAEATWTFVGLVLVIAFPLSAPRWRRWVCSAWSRWPAGFGDWPGALAAHVQRAAKTSISRRSDAQPAALSAPR